MDLEQLAGEVLKRVEGRQRMIVAVAGPPGSGKSTLADALAELLVAKGESAVVLPMDGFHMDNGILEARGLLKRKGAPETFDVRGFADILEAVRTGSEEVLVPVFDRSREIAIASARPIAPETRIIVAEGNYLLLDETPWSRLADAFDLTILLSPPRAVLEERLRARWVYYGLDEAGIEWKLYGNDLPNGDRIREKARVADITLEAIALPE
ncbi:nucleoside/nucleotide kinase family protein [Xaviernesmea oryzae]|uniref:Nucleoside/nucleotide kinase family protein n=1 Tax=Xaviernesmea oryzae TaxID=464029 RepID=A0A1Q9ASH6_9HYPH|nr:nucleoside triphosphate hydrolase [Xaviernesmea oryzae]OLP58336.1 nucleoside/nucleotide kinase family protein [Xaviernesmea oryzae]SEL41474.1 AAA domain-containing protein [Xaviernesmea oryzae]